MPIPADNIPIGTGRHPVHEQDATFFISKSVLAKIEKDGPTWKYDDACYITELIKNPDAIFENLKRKEFSDDCFCFSYQPEECKIGGSLQDKVFVSYVRPDFGGFVVFDWDWRKADSANPGHPIRWERDFGRRTWSKTLKPT